MTRPLWIAVSIFVGILLFAGILHIAFRSTAQLYFNLKESDTKQIKYIFEMDKRLNEMERKLSVFEQNLRHENKESQQGR